MSIKHQKVSWGVLGPGKIAYDFASDLQKVTNAELIAVGSQSSERANKFAHAYGIENVYTDYHPLVDDPEVDIIYIATTHNFHLNQTIKCLEAGKSVLCEKPITISTEEFHLLKEAHLDSGRYLMEGMWTYFLPAIEKAREWLKNGRIGQLRHLKAEFGYKVAFDADSRMYSPKLAGGALLDMGIYPIAMAAYFIEDPYRDIKVYARPAKTGVDMDVEMIFEYPNCLATLSTSFECKLPNYLYLIGENGYIAVPDFWKAKKCFLYEGDTQIDQFTDSRESFGFEYEIAAVCDDLLSKRLQSNVMSLRRSEQLQVMMEEVRNRFNFKH